MKNKTLWLLLLLPAVVAGCVWWQAAPKPVLGPGVVITSLSIEPPELEAGMPGYVTLIVQNQGEAKAKAVEAELLGLPRDEDGFVIPAREKLIGDLLPPDPERGFPEGQEGFTTWTLEAPKKDVTMDYDFSVRVYYWYEVYSESVLRVITMDYYMGLSPEERERKEWGIITSKVTAGPLKVTVEAPKPIVTKEVKKIPVWFKIENIGGGRVFKFGDRPVAVKEKREEKDFEFKVEKKHKMDAKYQYELKGDIVEVEKLERKEDEQWKKYEKYQPKGKYIIVEDTGTYRITYTYMSPITLDRIDVRVNSSEDAIKDCRYVEVVLIGGEYGRLSCTLDIGKIEDVKDYQITLTSFFRYYIDGYLTVRVLKRPIIG
jgi:hypothetical protein